MSKKDQEFEEFEEKIFDSMMERNPLLATQLGIHEYDDILPDGSKEKHLEDIELLEEWIEELEDFDPDDLSEENKLARKLGMHTMEMFLFREKELEFWKKMPSVPEVIGYSIFPLLKREYSPFQKRFDNILSRIKGIPEFVEESKDTLTEPVELWVDMAIESAEQLPMLFKLLLMVSKEKGIDEERLQELDAAVDDADEALDDYLGWLEEKKIDASEEFAIGEEKFDELLEKRELGYSAEEILSMGERYLEKTKESMKGYAEEIDPDKDVEEVLEEVTSETPDDFEGALDWYEEGLNDAIEFIKEEDLCTIPDNEELDVTQTPEFLRHIIPYAAYLSPPKFDDIRKGIYMVTPPSKDGDWKKQSYWDIRNTTVHEGYPGHHLQLSAAVTNDDVFTLFSHATETVEGWAHYCEEMMKEHGFDDTPEARLIQNRDLVWRAARIIVDVKLSTGKMTYQEAIDFLSDHVGLDKESAESEVKRYTQNPAYQLSYLLGKHMMMELKDEIKEEMGDEFSEKFFHDTILYAGSVPMKYLREIFRDRLEAQ